MPTSREVLAASNNAADQGFIEEAKLLYDEYKRLERLEYGITEPVEDPGFFENVASGLGAGAVGMGELTSLGVVTLLEEEAELAAREKIKSVGDSLRPKGGDPESLTYQVASGVGGILSALPITAVAGLGIKSAPVLAPLGAAAALGVAAMAGEQSEMARESGATEEERNIAIRKAAPFGVVEAISPARMLKGVGLKNFGDALDNLTGKIDDGLINGIVGRLQSAGVTGLVEGIQETASAIYQNLVARGYDPERELVDAGVIKEGQTGAGAGFVVQALADAIGRRSKRYDDLDAVTPEEVLAAAGYTDGVWDGEKMVYGEEAAKLVEQDIKKKGSTPDLFPKELTQARKAEAEKQGPIDPRKPKEPTEEKTEEPEPFTVKPATDTSRTPDMIERAEEQQIQELETAERKQKGQQEKTRLASEVETLSAQRDETMQRKTEEGRRKILDEVFDSVPEKGSNIRDVFRTRLAEAGYRAPEPTKTELTAIKRFLEVKEATTPPKEDTGMLPSDSDLSTLESQIKEKPDVGKQTDGAPVTEASGKGVQGSGEGVVGRQPTDTKRIGKLEQGRLDRGVDSARKPAGRKRRRVTSLKAQDEIADRLYTAAQGDLKDKNKYYTPEYRKDYISGYKEGYANKHGLSYNLQDNVDKRPTTEQGNIYSEGYYLGSSQARKDFKGELKSTPDTKKSTPLKITKNKALQTRKATGAVPNVTADGKLEYSEAKNFIPSHAQFKQDVTKLNTLSKVQPDTSGKAGKKDFAELNETATYFQKFSAPTSALYNLAYDNSNPGKDTTYVGKGAEALKGTGGKQAKSALSWVKKNLSPATFKAVTAQINKFNATDRTNKVEAGKQELKKKVAANTKPAKTEQVKSKAVDTKEEPTQIEIDFTAKFLGVDMRVYDALDNPITEKQVKLLQDGKLPEVLEQLSKSLTDSDIASFAAALSKVLTTTKVEFVAEPAIVKIAGKPEGKRTYVGKFDPETNTILLNKDVPLNAHVIIHESSHAFVDNFMRANPSASPVRAINRVYKDMMEKQMIFGAYGAENVYEFVAESMGNKKFRAHIDKMRLDDTGAVSNVSLFKRLIHAIRNLFRMLMGKDPIRKEPTALDQIDNWILQVLSPDHEGMAVYPVINNKNMSEAIESIYRPNDVKAPKRKVDFSDLWEEGKYKAGVPALKALTKVVDSQMLGDLAKFTALGDSGIKLHRAIEEQRGNMIAAADKMDVELRKYKDWVKASSEKMVRALNDLVYDVNYGATIYQVDPTLPLSTYLDADGAPKIVEGNNLYEIRQKQEQELKLLLPKDSDRKSVLAEFTRHRNIYRELFTRLKKSLNLVLDTLENAENKDAVASIRKSINQRIFDKPGLFVYLPLVRGGGAYGLSMTGRIDNGDGTFREEPVFITFKTRLDRKAFINLIPEMPEVVNNSYTEYNNTDSASFYEDAPRKGFVEDLLNLLEGANVESDVVKDVLQMYVDVLPETSFSKSFTKRLGRIGYIQDVGVALEQKGRSLASQVAKIEGSRKIRDAKDALIAKKETADSEFADVIANTFIKDHAGFALNGAANKPLEKVIKAVNQYSFMMTLGVNLSGAIVQLAQIPVQYGWLGARFGYDEAFSAIMRAQKVNLGAGLSPTQYYNLDTFEVKESTKRLIKKVSLGDEKKAQKRIQRLEDLAPLVELAYKRARMYSFKTMTDVGVTESQGIMTKATHISGLMFNAAERVNTNTALIASYDLVREKMAKQRKAGKKYYSVELGREIDVPKDVAELRKVAAQEALYMTSEINAGATLETTMPVAKQHMGRALLMYKHYGARMYATMIKYLYRSMPLTGLSKAEKKVARRQVMATIFVGLAYGGLMGFPLLGGLIGMIYDALTPDDEDNFDEMIRKAVPEYIAKGPVSYLSDVDIQARIKMTDLVFQENRFLYDASLEEQVGYYLGGPSISSFKKQLRGYEDFMDKRYDRAFENVAPVGISNMLQAERYAEEGGAKTRRGQFIVEDIPTSDLVAKAIGFRPYRLSKQQDINARNLRVQRTIVEERGDLMSKWNIATLNGDYERMEEVLDDIKEFSKKYPSYPITNKDLKKSAKSFQSRTDDMQHGVYINPKLKGIIEESNREFERDD